MKKILVILLSTLSLTIIAQNKKTVAVLEPITKDKNVNSFLQHIVRGTMESAVSATDEYEAFDRTAFDKIMEEQKFQRSGNVKDDQITRLGEMAGVDYILVTEVSADGGYMNVLVKILNVRTGQSTKSRSKLMEMTPPSVQNGCSDLAQQVFGIIDMGSGIRKGELLLEEGKYVGEIKNGKPYGKGKLTYKDSDTIYTSYEGEWNDGKKQGFGILILRDGSTYEGQFNNGLVSGKGTAYYTDGTKYMGEYKDGNPHGEGVYYYADGSRYDGHWENGTISGQGTYYYNDGRKYVGHFEENNLNGHGTLYFTTGEKYIGDFKDGIMSGQGIYYFSSGDKYEGSFENGWINGFGTHYRADGSKHVGYFKDGNRHGTGTTYFEGGRFEGNFNEEKVEGIGTFYYSVDNSIEKGNFVNGKQDGEWIRIESNGKKKKAKYSNGTLIRDWH